MAQVAEDGVDFQLISVPHNCHKADKYLSRIFTCDSRLWSQTHSEDETISVLSANGASLLWFFLQGYIGSSSTFKDIGTTFYALLFIAILALNPTCVLVSSQHDSLGISVPRL